MGRLLGLPSHTVPGHEPSQAQVSRATQRKTIHTYSSNLLPMGIRMGYKKSVAHYNHTVFSQKTTKCISSDYKFASRPLNPKGFVTTMALTLLPIVITSALCALGAFWFIEQKEKVQWICETHVLESQKDLVEGMKQLLALNPIIETTVLEIKFVKLALAAAPTPAEKAVLTAQLIFLRNKLILLKGQQNAIILKAHTLAQLDLATARTQLLRLVSHMESTWSTKLNMYFNGSRAQLKLKRKKIDPLATVYLEHPFLKEQQQVRIQFAITGENLFPSWMQWLTQKPIRWLESCKSQPNKESTLWVARLILDKF